MFNYVDEVLPVSLAQVVQESQFAGVRVEQDKILNSDSVAGDQSPFHVQLVGLLPHSLLLQAHKKTTGLEG